MRVCFPPIADIAITASTRTIFQAYWLERKSKVLGVFDGGSTTMASFGGAIAAAVAALLMTN